MTVRSIELIKYKREVVSTSYACRSVVLAPSVLYMHTPMLIASAIELTFLQATPGDVVNEAEIGSITLPAMVNVIPPQASLAFDVVVSLSVTGGTATSKDNSTDM